MVDIETIRSAIPAIPDFPKPGVLFRDISPLMEKPELFDFCIDNLCARYKNSAVNHIVCLESRGFLFGPTLGSKLKIPCSLIRKQGKLPRKTISVTSTKEYGEDILEIHADSLNKDSRVLILDDLMATGGTAKAAIELVETAGATAIEVACIVELLELNGKANFKLPLYSLLKF